jgi:hypothetical protein
MKAWLKGGLIASGIVLIIWIIWLLFTIIGMPDISIVFRDSFLFKQFLRNILGQLWTMIDFFFITIIVAFVLVAIIISIIKKIAKNKETIFLKSWKVGFWISLILSILVWVAWQSANPKERFTGALFGFFLVLILGNILGSLIGLIIQKIKSK